MYQKSGVYVGLGGNIGDSLTILSQALHYLTQIPEVYDLKASRFYRTSPVGDLTQAPFVNAVCHLKTHLSPLELLIHLQAIEKKLGKVPKPKWAARPLDLDLLFYGHLTYKDPQLSIPHPHWQERLFVLVPLADLIAEIKIQTSEGLHLFKLKDLIQKVENESDQTISIIQPDPFLNPLLTR